MAEIVLSSAEKEEVERCWSDVPEGVLSLISSFLFAADYCFFGATCRSWRSISRDSRLPVSVDSLFVNSSCLMYAASSKMLTFFHPIYDVAYHTEMPELLNAVIRSSNHGWLLMSRDTSCVFFFNPVTKARIELPDVPFHPFGIDAMCFSSPPTCSDCVVFAVSYYQIATIKRGEEDWTSHEFDAESWRDYKGGEIFIASDCNPVLHKGRYYYLGVGGSVVIFDPKDNRCRWPACGRILKRIVGDCLQSYLIESVDGDLLAVFVAATGARLHVFKLDTSKIAWQEVKSLGDQILYVSNAASFSETAVVRGTGNNIFFPRLSVSGNNFIFYSLATRKYHCFVGNYSHKEFYKSREPKNSTWIKPTVATICHEKLVW